MGSDLSGPVDDGLRHLTEDESQFRRRRFANGTGMRLRQSFDFAREEKKVASWLPKWSGTAPALSSGSPLRPPYGLLFLRGLGSAGDAALRSRLGGTRRQRHGHRLARPVVQRFF